ncbi:PIN domain-containing protein [Shewanella algae]|uniref:PIN domain-containing protein n=1 Tax=Shewanella algae TaxID=38313 RepID=UPI001AACD7D9|nr:PIN domain-containing protein [Shewanella algae]MBO2556535.1 DUF4935 domain-containing protein [Shewanella algae]MBO2573469.1 DUF4935 domain-containing protein [Shewanella algae]
MRNTFPWFYKKTDQELKELFDKAVFVFDTNVLLNLYRYSDSTRKDFFQVLEQLRARCFMPHQVAHEYFGNRLSVIYSQKETYGKTIAKAKELKSDMDNSKQHPFVSEKLSLRISKVFDDLFEELNEGKREHSSRLDDDEILEQLSNIFDNVGSEKSSDELVKIAEEGDKRYREKIPPGFEDAGKANEKKPFVERMKAYGDYLIWLEILEYAEKNKVDLIFITDDVKVDWWQKEKGNIIGPRIELVKEFSAKTGKKLFHMYTSEEFFKSATECLDVEVNEHSIGELQELTLSNIIPSSGNDSEKINYDSTVCVGLFKSDRDLRKVDFYSKLIKRYIEYSDYLAVCSFLDDEVNRYDEGEIDLNQLQFDLLHSIRRMARFLLDNLSSNHGFEFRKIEGKLAGEFDRYFDSWKTNTI